MVEFKRKSLELLYDAKIVALYKDVLETPAALASCFMLLSLDLTATAREAPDCARLEHT